MADDKRALTIVEKIDGIAFNSKSRFMEALAQTLPQNPLVLAPALVRQALTVIKTSDTLQKCSEYSLFNSIVEVAQSGLSLDPHLGQSYLVPFSNICTVMYGYRGLIELARRSGEVGEIVGEIRYAKDKFSMVLGTERQLVHVPFDAPESKRGERVGAYAICVMQLRRPVFEYMDAEQILKIKNAVVKRAKGKTTVWQTENENEMWRKTPIRRLAKRLPQSPAMIPFIQAAIRDEERQQAIVKTVEVAPPIAEILREEKIIEEPMRVDARETPIKEKPAEEQKEEQAGPISREQWDQIYDNFCITGKITSQQVIQTMKSKFGHTGPHLNFPAAKFQALVETLTKKVSKK